MGRAAVTYESLYLSPALEERLQTCYWAYPESYAHVAIRPVRRADILWSEEEVADYELLKQKTEQLQKNIPGYVKEIVKEHLKGRARPE
ncbi:MAG: hypothetical protein HYZ89_07860 [Candidatus Omnitrophica bacterium]|nr:hypothetical protein [Candidatus Omnitrophota bacterium]